MNDSKVIFLLTAILLVLTAILLIMLFGASSVLSGLWWLAVIGIPLTVVAILANVLIIQAQVYLARRRERRDTGLYDDD